MGEAAQGRLEEPEELQRPLQGPEGHDAALGRLDAEGEGAGVNGLGPGRPGFGFGAKASLSLGGRGFPGDSLLGPLAHLFFLKVRGQRPCFRMEGRQGLGVEERGGGVGGGLQPSLENSICHFTTRTCHLWVPLTTVQGHAHQPKPPRYGWG